MQGDVVKSVENPEHAEILSYSSVLQGISKIAESAVLAEQKLDKVVNTVIQEEDLSSSVSLLCDEKLQVEVRRIGKKKPQDISTPVIVTPLNVQSLTNKIFNLRENINYYEKFDALLFNEANCIVEKLPNGINDILLDNFHIPKVQKPTRTSGLMLRFMG